MHFLNESNLQFSTFQESNCAKLFDDDKKHQKENYGFDDAEYPHVYLFVSYV